MEDKFINTFQKKKHKGTTLHRVSDNLRVKFRNLRQYSQICNTCRFELTNSKERSFLICDNTARIPNQVQSDIDTVVNDDDAGNNKCNPDFSIPLKVNDTKMQCDDEYHKLVMKKFSSSEKYDIIPKGQKKKPQKRPAKLPPKAKKIAKKHNSTKNSLNLNQANVH